MTPIAILLAAAAVNRRLYDKGISITSCSLSPFGFRLEGTHDGKRLVVVATYFERGREVEVVLGRQVGRSARELRAVAADHTTAALVALGG